MMYGEIASNIAQNPIVVTCHPEAKLVLIGIEFVQISGISFFDCVGNTVSLVKQLSFENCSLQNNALPGVCMIGLRLNLINNVRIQSTSFSIKHTEPFKRCVSESEVNTASTVIRIHDCSNVSITTVFFEGSKMRDSKLMYVSNSTVNVYDTSFINNIANNGTIINVVNSVLRVHQCIFLNNTYISDTVSNIQAVSGRTLVAGSSTIEIESTKFLYEMTEIDTLDIQNSTLVLNGCAFVSNVARRPSNEYYSFIESFSSH